MILRVPKRSVFIYTMPQGKNAKDWARHTLARLLNLPCAPLEFNPLGKPILPAELGFANWSNSRGECVLAFSKNCEVGIDLEFYRDRDFFALSKRFFAPAESTGSAENFYRLWTRKEAFYKCCGGDFFSVLKTESASLETSPIWNFQGPYREQHELALCLN